MSIRNYSHIVLSMFIATGCATNHFKRNEQFSSAGTEYTESVSELLKATQARLIEVNSKLLVIGPKSTPEARLKAINTENESLVLLIDKIDEYRRHNDLLGRYFKELESVTNAGKETDLGITIAKLSGTIAALNKTEVDEYGLPIDPIITGNQKGHLEDIADQIVKTHYAKKIQRQLLRDSKIIATQLFLQGKQLDNLIDIMKVELKSGETLHLNEHVIEPYVKGEVDSLYFDTWADNRKHWFELRRTEDVFKSVKEAQQAMMWAWEDILRGKHDISSVNHSLKDTNRFVDSLNAFKTNRPKTRVPIQ